jgi:hypothetical protein
MDVPYDETDRQLFNAATKITLGDGAKALFWHSAWLDGASPKDIAPSIFFSKQKEEQNSTTGAAGQFMGAGHKHSCNQHGSAVDTICCPLGSSSACPPQFEHS